MLNKWRYGEFKTITFSDFNMHGPRATLTAALLTESTGTSVISTWKAGDGRDLFAAMDTLGADGWIIGTPEWISFGAQAELNHQSMPRSIRLALEDLEGLPPRSLGYSRYLLRRQTG